MSLSCLSRQHTTGKSVHSANAQKVREAFEGREDAAAKRALKYYETLIPMVYNNDAFGIRGVFRKAYSWWLGRNKPMVREVS